MPEENVEIIQRIYAALDPSRPFDGISAPKFAELVDPEIEWRAPREFPGLAESVYGVEGVKRYGEKIAEVLDD